MSKQKHDPGFKKRKKNLLLNPEPLSRAQRVEKRNRERELSSRRRPLDKSSYKATD